MLDQSRVKATLSGYHPLGAQLPSTASPLDRMRILPLALLALPLTACGDAGRVGPGQGSTGTLGLVIQNPDPVDPARPHFFDLGEMDHGSRQELPIYFENTGKEPITILEADPACACTSAKRIRTVNAEGAILQVGDVKRRGDILTVPAGGRMELLLGINTKTLSPNRDKLAILRLRTDSASTPWITLELHLSTTLPFLLTPASIQLGLVPQSHGGSGQCRIMTGTAGAEGRVLGIRSSSDSVEAHLDYLFVNEEHVWTLTARLLPLQPMGPARSQVILETVEEGGEEGTLSVDVWAQVVDDVGLDRANPHFGVVPIGQSRKLSLDLTARVPGSRTLIREVLLTGPAAEHLTVSWKPKESAYVDEDGHSQRWSITMVTDKDLPPGRFEADLLVTLADEQNPEVRATVQGVVR